MTVYWYLQNQVVYFPFLNIFVVLFCFVLWCFQLSFCFPCNYLPCLSDSLTKSLILGKSHSDLLLHHWLISSQVNYKILILWPPLFSWVDSSASFLCHFLSWFYCFIYMSITSSKLLRKCEKEVHFLRFNMSKNIFILLSHLIYSLSWYRILG